MTVGTLVFVVMCLTVPLFGFVGGFMLGVWVGERRA